MEVFKFKPILKTLVWGGEKIAPYKGIETTQEHIGESWELSGVPGNESIVAEGPLAGRSIASLVKEFKGRLVGESVYGRCADEFPLLIKFIDAQKDLSIQVHPSDELAAARHGCNGKTEMWYVIDAAPGAALYAGLKQAITPEEYEKRVADGSITQVLSRYEVHPGDVFFLPAGRIHAICAGCLIAEIQQTSDITYRIFDYNRPGLDGNPRELHTALAAKALDFHVERNYRTDYPELANRATQIIDTPYFDVRVMEVSKPFHRDLRKYDSFIITMCIEGDCVIHVRSTGDEILLKEGYSTLIPAAIADFDILPQQGRTRILDAFIDNMDRSLATMVTRFLHLSD